MIRTASALATRTGCRAVPGAPTHPGGPTPSGAGRSARSRRPRRTRRSGAPPRTCPRWSDRFGAGAAGPNARFLRPPADAGERPGRRDGDRQGGVPDRQAEEFARGVAPPRPPGLGLRPVVAAGDRPQEVLGGALQVGVAAAEPPDHESL